MTRLHSWIDALPEAKLAKLTAGLAVLREAFGEPSSCTTPYTPVKLGGLWAGIKIDEQQIAQVRRGMWANFGEDLPLITKDQKIHDARILTVIW